ncbi:50S ribosomal protein L7 [Desulfofundulus thermobenzoicus]|uniref:50S ribosomal protein L7 n=1 Tax=Desulfofundulus thermobenzoicus TaxID=29376 RepID=A0A6N7ITN4_9FIRM|nr:L7Ae/L30e/S12e/Gadd45 family ribosomal protein [Desulfofundulus thermobenzoicus]MQL52458.1 50S ribosomal protein L7 [Desulfofundulus thermobenzoicus]HHW44393.1 50S ribosomal protein L7 [Desulfotomaculum sp.]
MDERIKQMLFLARRAGGIVAGDKMVRRAIERGRARLVVVARDASAHTQRTFLFFSRRTGVPVVNFGSKDQLGQVFNRSSCAVAAITDENFSRGILGIMQRGD